MLLHDPSVAVGVAEEDERGEGATLWVWPRHPPARLEMPNLAGVDATFHEPIVRSFDVRDDQVQASGGARLLVHNPGVQMDRAGRSGRGQLHEARPLADPGV